MRTHTTTLLALLLLAALAAAGAQSTPRKVATNSTKHSPPAKPKSPPKANATAAASGPLATYTQYSSFAECFKAAGLTNTTTAMRMAGAGGFLSSPNLQITVLAPTDAAWAEFAKASGTNVQELLNNPFRMGLVRQLMYYHMIPGAYLATVLKNGMAVNTLLPSGGKYAPLAVARDDAAPSIGFGGVGTSAMVRRPNMICGKGVAHSISRVLLPFKIGSS